MSLLNVVITWSVSEIVGLIITALLILFFVALKLTGSIKDWIKRKKRKTPA